MAPLPSSEPASVRNCCWPLLATLGFGLLLFLILPAGVAVLNDDFGYLRSVVETVQHGRPWTNDWLEPWAASFSLLAALLYRTTGSFLFAIQGLQALLAAISFWAAFSLFKARGHSPGRSLALSGLLLTFPTLLWKSVEFTSLALYLPCLLLAIYAAEKRKWGWFCVGWGLAIASRQSAVTWGFFPAVEIFLLMRSTQGGPRHVWAPCLTLLGGIILFGALTWSMNKTHAQAVITDHLLDRLAWPTALRAAGLGFLAYFCGAGLSGFFSASQGPVRSPALMRLLPAAITLLLLGALRFDWISFEHGLFSGYLGAFYCGIVVLLSAAGWLADGFQLRPAPAVAALGSVILLSLRPGIWDYYLLDVALLGLFGTMIQPAASDPAPIRSTGWFRFGILGVLALFHGLFVLNIKCTLDRAYALCSLAESALRKELLRPTELSFTPFGFSGWHLHRHFTTHEGAADPNVAGFNGYLIPGAVEVGQGYSRALHVFPRFRHEPPGDRHNLIMAGRYRFAWFFEAEFFLLRFKTEQEAPPAFPLRTDAYRAEHFPLNDAEWRTFIDSHKSNETHRQIPAESP